MLETMPYKAKQKHQAKKRHNLVMCVVWFVVFIACAILLYIYPMPIIEMPADGEYLYNRYLLLVSLACVSVIVGIVYLIKSMDRS